MECELVDSLERLDELTSRDSILFCCTGVKHHDLFQDICQELDKSDYRFAYIDANTVRSKHRLLKVPSIIIFKKGEKLETVHTPTQESIIDVIYKYANDLFLDSNTLEIKPGRAVTSPVSLPESQGSNRISKEDE